MASEVTSALLVIVIILFGFATALACVGGEVLSSFEHLKIFAYMIAHFH